ncbi:Gnt-II system L-idonate transporter [Pirellulimonas nuda]|uniref:Gnt-II system L-idonate transporter n=1 Tax=Pirellulimonas nuda TaxID=2528009 RepID=A0A518DGU4_9BACT|nr:GntP family permease [Pirellulimonas nuda]QDU90686.1 Gnt-II system L-idonate transporter [Pirellulimonas nuda]
MPELPPLAIFAVGIVTVLGLMIGLKLHAFVALICAALVVSLLSPGDPADVVPRLTKALGESAGKIAVIIAMAAVIGRCMLDSGAADRIVQAMLRLFGPKRSSTALAASGFFLSAPVFFDTVFFLLAPLARSLYKQTHRDYLKYLMAICAGGVVTHTMVPPTPGPVAAAEELSVGFGMMMLVGSVIGVPMAVAGLAFTAWCNRRMPIAMRPFAGDDEPPETDEPATLPLPRLIPALLPVVLPVLMIATGALSSYLAKDADPASFAARSAPYGALVGNPSLALIASAAVALTLLVAMRRPTRRQVAELVEESLGSAAVIILITAAGGAFGAMLAAAGIGGVITQQLGDVSQLADKGELLLVMAFATASLLKFSQGSSTVAMTTTSALLAGALSDTGLAALPFHPVYLAAAIGAGSLVGSWMNDSGFWIYCKMGGLTEVESLKTWTPLLAIMGTVGLLTTLVAANVAPLQ